MTLKETEKLVEHLDAAAASHRQWKRRLSAAIDSGNGTFKVADVSRDDQCEFGGVLKTGTSAAQRKSPSYLKVKDLHAQFHLEAGRILQLAHEGRRAEAWLAIDHGSLYETLIATLLAEISLWKKRLESEA
jgi:hypothetical protein